jgi:hypothetical protein
MMLHAEVRGDDENKNNSARTATNQADRLAS